MRKTITGAEQSAQLAGFRTSAWRFERQRTYSIDQEDRQLQSFLAGHPIPPAEDAEHPELEAWMKRVAAHVAAGRSVGRVRIVDDPPTDYQRWLQWLDVYNRQAGEEISYLSRAVAHEVGLLTAESGPDWWLLDDERLILIHFNEAGQRTFAELIEDSPEVADAREFRTKAIQAASAHRVGAEQTSFLRPGGSPPVVFISQLGCGAAIWTGVLEHLPDLATVTYDRPGIGDTPPRPAPNPALPYSMFADELAALLDTRTMPDPVILVGHSVGGLIAHVFAARYPHRVAGLVMVDRSIPALHVYPSVEPKVDGDGPGATEIDTVSGHLEVIEAGLPGVPAVVVARTHGRWDGKNPLPHPAVEDLWRAYQRQLTRQLDCPLIVADNSGHQLQREAPDLIAYAVTAVHEAVRTGKDVAIEPERLADAGGHLDR